MRATRIFAFLALVTLFFIADPISSGNFQSAQFSQGTASEVIVGAWLINIEKVDLPANSYTLDFYLWFRFNATEVDPEKFEFINGKPTSVDKIYEEEGYLEYRVRGVFVKTFDFSRFPFETHELTVELEDKKLNMTQLIYDPDTTYSGIDETLNIAGWNVRDFEVNVVEHSYKDEAYSRFVFSVKIERPVLSSFFKSVLPIMVITTISLLAFFISPQNFSQRIGLGVTTLLSATAFHLALLSGIPSTGYLTLADRIMLSIYTIFLFNLAVSVYIMKLVDAKKTDEAARFNKKALKILPLIIMVLAITQFIFF
jgi:hypothetical protein